jgi:hypothetical protein
MKKMTRYAGGRAWVPFSDRLKFLHEEEKVAGKKPLAVHIAYLLLISTIGDIDRLPLFSRDWL